MTEEQIQCKKDAWVLRKKKKKIEQDPQSFTKYLR